jgi:hypothetical protein
MSNHTRRYLKPHTTERLFGRLLVGLVWIGLIWGHFYVLEVRGRKSGRMIRLPVDPIDFEGRRYLVCARGNSNWVRNTRVAGEVALVRAMHRQRYTVRELPHGMRPAILKAYLDRFASEVQRFFPLPRGSPEEAFNAVAQDYPVFELSELGSRC